jgi:hypothetical protein
MKCPACGRQEPRSSDQNRRYWKIISLLSDVSIQGQKYNPASWHEYFKIKFLGATEINMPNGKTLIVPNSSTDLDVPAFNEFMTQVEVWANEHNIYLGD